MCSDTVPSPAHRPTVAPGAYLEVRLAKGGHLLGEQKAYRALQGQIAFEIIESSELIAIYPLLLHHAGVLRPSYPPYLYGNTLVILLGPTGKPERSGGDTSLPLCMAHAFYKLSG